MSAQAQGQRPSERVENILRLKKIVAEHPEDVAARVELGNALDDNGDSAADRIGPRLAIGWTMGTLVSALGVYLSVKMDTPT
ncbi:MAG: hypothetical protein M1451_13115, partial [Acidobacteria bacterium]|nr:hypothetical protein [Acidobacteriota bacterium]